MKRLKHCLTRELFRSLKITEFVFQNLLMIGNLEIWKTELRKQRSIIFEVIAVIWIDDYQNNYFASLQNISENINLTLQNGYNNVKLLIYY